MKNKLMSDERVLHVNSKKLDATQKGIHAD